MSAIPAPAIDPRRPARGSADRTALPDSESAILKMPTSTVTAMPTFHASTASPVVRYAGPRIANEIPNTLGAFNPSGIAVTSLLPVRRARRRAIPA